MTAATSGPARPKYAALSQLPFYHVCILWNGLTMPQEMTSECTSKEMKYFTYIRQSVAVAVAGASLAAFALPCLCVLVPESCSTDDSLYHQAFS